MRQTKSGMRRYSAQVSAEGERTAFRARTRQQFCHLMVLILLNIYASRAAARTRFQQSLRRVGGKVLPVCMLQQKGVGSGRDQRDSTSSLC